MTRSSTKSLRDQFLAWQCRLRRIAMREHGGRPSAGLSPRLADGAGREISAGLTLLLTRKEPAESTALFRHQVLGIQDPRTLYERGLAYLQADYFQEPEKFSDRLVAVLPQGSGLAATILAEKTCRLDFEEAGRSFIIPCAVRELLSGDAAREAAIWHNRLFNPSLPDSVRVLAFKPDWTKAEATPQG